MKYIIKSAKERSAKHLHRTEQENDHRKRKLLKIFRKDLYNKNDYDSMKYIIKSAKERRLLIRASEPSHSIEEN